MRHLSEEQLVLHYYGEECDSTGHLAGHLESCAVCRKEYRDIVRVLDACREFPAPEPAEGFETLTWQKIAPELKKRPAAWWSRVWILAPVMTGLLIAAFFMGRVSTVKAPPVVNQASSAQGRERILLVALGDHLERSQMVLVELVNAKPADAPDIRIAQERARNLVSENRLYRQTASMSGDNEFLGLLDELERVLTDVANSPERMSSPELKQIQERIESRGLIFKIRVVDSNLQQKGAEKL